MSTDTPKKVTKSAPVSAAAAILLSEDKKRAKKAVADNEMLNAESLFYIRCPRYTEHMGMFFTEYPTGPIHPGMWFSLVHTAGDPYFEREVVCQECLADGDNGVHLWLTPKMMPDRNISFVVAPPPATKCIFPISRRDLEMHLGKTIEELMNPASIGAANESAVESEEEVVA